MTKVLSTKDAARVCKVALSTIVYWFDKGLIKGYRTPGGHRRIFLQDLETFMTNHKIPLAGRLPDEKFRVLVVDDEPQVAEFFSRTLASLDGEIEFASAVNGFQAGRLLSTFRPNLVFLDIVMPSLDGLRSLQAHHERPRHARCGGHRHHRSRQPGKRPADPQRRRQRAPQKAHSVPRGQRDRRKSSRLREPNSATERAFLSVGPS